MPKYLGRALPPSRYYSSGYDVGGYIVGDVMLDDIGEVVSPIAGLSIISVSWSEHQLCNGEYLNGPPLWHLIRYHCLMLNPHII